MVEHGVAAISTRRVGGWDLLLAAGKPDAMSGLAVLHYVPQVEMVVAWTEYRHARWIETDKPSAGDVKSRTLWLRQDVRRWRGEAVPPRVADREGGSGRPVPLPGAPAVWLPTTLCRIDNRPWREMVDDEALAAGAYGRDQVARDLDEALCTDCRARVGTGPDGTPEPGSLRAFMELAAR